MYKTQIYNKTFHIISNLYEKNNIDMKAQTSVSEYYVLTNMDFKHGHKTKEKMFTICCNKSKPLLNIINCITKRILTKLYAIVKNRTKLIDYPNVINKYSKHCLNHQLMQLKAKA